MFWLSHSHLFWNNLLGNRDVQNGSDLLIVIVACLVAKLFWFVSPSGRKNKLNEKETTNETQDQMKEMWQVIELIAQFILFEYIGI